MGMEHPTGDAHCKGTSTFAAAVEPAVAFKCRMADVLAAHHRRSALHQAWMRWIMFVIAKRKKEPNCGAAVSDALPQQHVGTTLPNRSGVPIPTQAELGSCGNDLRVTVERQAAVLGDKDKLINYLTQQRDIAVAQADGEAVAMMMGLRVRCAELEEELRIMSTKSASSQKGTRRGRGGRVTVKLVSDLSSVNSGPNDASHRKQGRVHSFIRDNKNETNTSGPTAMVHPATPPPATSGTQPQPQPPATKATPTKRQATSNGTGTRTEVVAHVLQLNDQNQFAPLKETRHAYVAVAPVSAVAALAQKPGRNGAVLNSASPRRIGPRSGVDTAAEELIDAMLRQRGTSDVVRAVVVNSGNGASVSLPVLRNKAKGPSADSSLTAQKDGTS